MDHNNIINKLCASGYSAYLVGGCVRDEFDGKTPDDYDIVTQATPDEIARVFEGYKVNLVGKSFGVTLVEDYEVATFRVDHYGSKMGAKNCIPSFNVTIHDDLARRDFTVNSIALCPISGDIIDPFNGLQDLQKRVIRFVGNPDDRINEDPNRIIRACRFVAKLQGAFDIDTLNALRSNITQLKNVDKERIGKEVKKAMALEYPSLFFGALYIIGALDFVFPGMSECVGHSHGKHHKENVWEHLMIAGDSVNTRFPLVRLASFLHDVGKPGSFKRNADGTFIGHELVSGIIAEKWLRRLKFSNSEVSCVVALIKSHMLGGYNDMTPKAVRKLRLRLSEENINYQDWIRLRISDRNANINKVPFNIRGIRNNLELFNDIDVTPVFSVNSLALKGGDIMNLFSLQPSKLIGDIQKHLLNYVIECGFEYNTSEDLRREAIEFLLLTLSEGRCIISDVGSKK